MVYVQSLKEVESLEYHSHSFLKVTKNLFVLNIYGHIADCDRAFIIRFKAVDAAKESGFTCAALSDNAEYLTFSDVDIYSLKNFGFVKSFFDVFYLYHG